MQQHPVIFVSLGPGEAELITLKGWKALQCAHYIFCPETQKPNGQINSRAAQILHELGITEDNVHRFTLPMNKRREAVLNIYDQVCQEMATLQQKGLKVCIVTEGDAGLYASIHYVYEKLGKQGILVEHIAGVPAFIAAGARAGLHLASRGQTLTILPGTATTDTLEDLLQAHGSVVIMKLSQCTDEIHRYIRQHPEYDYHYFENIGTKQERYFNDTSQIIGLRFPYFSLLIVKSGSFSI